MLRVSASHDSVEGGVGCGPHVEVLHRLGDIELVHGGDDDGRGGEEEEEDEEDDVDDQAAQPPDEASDGEVLPGEARGVTPWIECQWFLAMPRTSLSYPLPTGAHPDSTRPALPPPFAHQ